MRQTKKYVAAVETSKKSGLRNWATQAGLYELLTCNGYMWDSKTGKWLFLPEMDADAPSPLIKVRVWADALAVDMVAREIVTEMGNYLTLVERSEVYPCRPPKQKEGRVYLTFK
jgi:hypothetical protein